MASFATDSCDENSLPDVSIEGGAVVIESLLGTRNRWTMNKLCVGGGNHERYPNWFWSFGFKRLLLNAKSQSKAEQQLITPTPSGNKQWA